jgi:SAM-dependent methyltransferase
MIPSLIKKIIKIFLPNSFINFKDKFLINLNRKKFARLNLKTKDTFSKIYTEQLWTPDNKKNIFQYYSGLGSHDAEFIDKYVIVISEYLLSFKTKPSVVDLGCGDFNIGSKLRKYCSTYNAVDIVDDLINYNIQKYKDLKVDFMALDIIKDKVPTAEICFLRLVLQHLSNNDISNFLELNKKNFNSLIVTEHYPDTKNFVPNIDKPTGPDIRLFDNSAVVLTAPPFNLKFKKEIDLCEIFSNKIKGSLKTKLFIL